MSSLEWVGLGSSFFLPFRAITYIMSHFFALVANHLADVFLVGVVLGFLVWPLSRVMSLLPAGETGDMTDVFLVVSIASFGSTIAVTMFEVTPFIMVIPLFVAMVHLRSMVSFE